MSTIHCSYASEVSVELTCGGVEWVCHRTGILVKVDEVVRWWYEVGFLEFSVNCSEFIRLVE